MKTFKEINIFIIFFIFITIVSFSTTTSSYNMVVSKDNYDLITFIPKEDPLKSELILNSGIDINNYYLLDMDDSFPPEVFSFEFKKFINFQATSSINIIPGKFTSKLIAQCESNGIENLNEVIIKLVKYSEMDISSSKLNNISPSEYKSGVLQISITNNIFEIEEYSGNLELKILELNKIKEISFINGIGTLNMEDVQELPPLNVYTFEGIYNNNKFTFIIFKENGVFKSPKYLKD